MEGREAQRKAMLIPQHNDTKKSSPQKSFGS